MTPQQQKKPTAPQRYLTLSPKTTATGLAASFSVLLFYVLDAAWGVDPPDEVKLAIGGIIATFLSWLAPHMPQQNQVE